jgi:hypothetical protein
MLLFALVLVAACTSTPASSAHIELGEFWLSTDREVLAAGVVELTVQNTGSYGHTVVVTTDSGEVVAASDLIPPGTGADLALSLGPGTYALTCRIVSGQEDGSVIDHYQEGMLAKVKVVRSTR